MREVALVSPRRAAGPGRNGSAKRTQRYWAFLSYSHKDSDVADWLHGALEKYRVPSSLVGRESACGTIPASFNPIFRDRHELAASGDLGQTIREALGASRCLIVLCSPDAAQSRWTNEEILAFKKLNPAGCILGVIVAGEPFASEMKGRDKEECFPPALRQKFDSRGRPTGKRAEPIAADLREHGDGRQLGLLKIVAGVLGIGLDELVQREQTRRHKRLTYIAAASLAGMTLTSGLAVFAFDKRDEARDQRREAEGLVGFMLGDLRQKLEPIGRLDVLDAVGSRALQYFAKQDKSELSDAALAQRSRALTLMGDIANTRGDLEGALARYREAMAGTGEMLRRKPGDPQRLFDHAQNVFWVGDVAMRRGQIDKAETAMREYKRLADAMVAVEPANPKYRLETKYADSNLGIILFKQRRYREAALVFQQALVTSEGLAAANPKSQEFQKTLPEALAWLGDAQFGEGRLDEAIAKRERQVALLENLHRRYPFDVDYRQRQIPARRALGRWLASAGSLNAGLEHVRSAVEIGNQLIPMDPENMRWLQYTAGAQFDLAKILLELGRQDEAASQARAGCELADRLSTRDRSDIDFRKLAVDCLGRRAEIAMQRNAHDEALSLAERALRRARAIRSGDAVDDRFFVARIYILIGGIQSKAGNPTEAQQAWRAGLETWPQNEGENPRQIAIRSQMLTGLGQNGAAQALNARLAAIGYRRLI